MFTGLQAWRSEGTARLIVRLELAFLLVFGVSLTLGWSAAIMWGAYRAVLWLCMAL